MGRFNQKRTENSGNSDFDYELVTLETNMPDRAFETLCSIINCFFTYDLKSQTYKRHKRTFKQICERVDASKSAISRLMNLFKQKKWV